MMNKTELNLKATEMDKGGQIRYTGFTPEGEVPKFVRTRFGEEIPLINAIAICKTCHKPMNTDRGKEHLRMGHRISLTVHNCASFQSTGGLIEVGVYSTSIHNSLCL